MADKESKELLSFGMDVFDILRNDHKTVSKIIEEFKRIPLNEREGVLSLLDTEIIRHSEIEERYFYPRLQEYKELAELIWTAVADHDDMKNLLHRMENRESDAEEWTRAFALLEETVEDHLEMEEKEIFPLAMNLLSEEELSLMREQVMEAKKKIPQPHRHRDVGPPRVKI